MPARSAGGLLIVNADDLGLSPADTDAVLDSFHAGAITSATAMVWMKDSDRAAALAREATLPVGLHLNLVEPYTAPDVPAEVAATQQRVLDALTATGRGAYMYHPRWRRDFDRCIADQLRRFVELHGTAPTHLDGHQHMHLVPNALLSPALAGVTRCRRPVARMPAEGRRSSQVGRAILAQLLRARFTTTDWCFSLPAVNETLSAEGASGKLQLARTESVEVYTHPAWPDERAVLSSSEWGSELARYRLGAFSALAP